MAVAGYAALEVSLVRAAQLRICGLCADIPLSGCRLQSPQGNHIPIFNDAGLETTYYKYYKPSTKGLDLDGVLADIKAAPQKSVFLFHACAHNPTGVDPTPDQWAVISRAIKEKEHFVILDSAYQVRALATDAVALWLQRRGEAISDCAHDYTHSSHAGRLCM